MANRRHTTKLLAPARPSKNGRDGVKYVHLQGCVRGAKIMHAQLTEHWVPIIEAALAEHACVNISEFVLESSDAYPDISLSDAVKLHATKLLMKSMLRRGVSQVLMKLAEDLIGDNIG